MFATCDVVFFCQVNSSCVSFYVILYAIITFSSEICYLINSFIYFFISLGLSQCCSYQFDMLFL